MPDSNSITNCLNLADRLYEKYVLRRPVVRPSARPARSPNLKVHRPMKVRPLYGKHNPMPPVVRQRILAKVARAGALKMSFVQIADEERCSARTVNDIARSAGIHRGKGNWRLAA